MHEYVNNNNVRESDCFLTACVSNLSNHIDGAGSCCCLAVFLRVADRLIVVRLVEGVQRRVDQVDHQYRIHLTKELTYLEEFTCIHTCMHTQNSQLKHCKSLLVETKPAAEPYFL